MNLILGDGLLGSAVIGSSGWTFVSRKENGFDINKPNQWRSSIPGGTTTIINLVANTDTYSNDVFAMFNTNYRGVVDLVDYCNVNKIKLVHFSTDYVYENSRTNAKETNKAKPVTPYAVSKLLADEYIMKHSNSHLILRGSQKIDPFPYDTAFTNVYGNFDYADIIADIVVEMIKTGATGLFNIGTPKKSMFDLAKLTKSDVKPGIAPDHFPKDITMNLNKMIEWLDQE